MADDSRKDMTRPRVRISPNTNVSNELRRVYGPKPGIRVMQGDPGCSPPISRDGTLPASKVGFKNETNEFQPPQAPADKHSPNYDNNTASDWRRGMGKNQAEAYPAFAPSKKAKGAAGLGGGGDAKKSPFSSANKVYNGD